jgi:hypothetical protein
MMSNSSLDKSPLARVSDVSPGNGTIVNSLPQTAEMSESLGVDLNQDAPLSCPYITLYVHCVSPLSSDSVMTGG